MIAFEGGQQTIGKHQVWQTMRFLMRLFPSKLNSQKKSFNSEDLPKIDLSERVCERALCLPSTSSSLSWLPTVIKSLLALVFITKLPLHSVSCNDYHQTDTNQYNYWKEREKKETQYVMLPKGAEKLNKLKRCRALRSCFLFLST